MVAAKSRKMQRSACFAFSSFNIGTCSEQGVDSLRVVVERSNVELLMISKCK